MNNNRYIHQPFVRIPADYLASIHDNHPDTPTLYFHNNPVMRYVFWSRLAQIHSFMQRSSHRRDVCMDFGGGSGVFLPMLCQLFEKVVLVDLHPEQAYVIKDKYGLNNCEIVQTNIFEYSPFPCDAIIAADVLEHFEDSSEIIGTLQSFMQNGSTLYTSLPTESVLYRTLRTVFGIEKPDDHYADASSIEYVLKEQGFIRRQHRRLPIPRLALTELFSVSAWSK